MRDSEDRTGLGAFTWCELGRDSVQTGVGVPVNEVLSFRVSLIAHCPRADQLFVGTSIRRLDLYDDLESRTETGTRSRPRRHAAEIAVDIIDAGFGPSSKDVSLVERGADHTNSKAPVAASASANCPERPPDSSCSSAIELESSMIQSKSTSTAVRAAGGECNGTWVNPRQCVSVAPHPAAKRRKSKRGNTVRRLS